MLFFQTFLATLLLSTAAGDISTLGESAPSGAPLITPQDPSTLVLALIGAGTVVVYMAFRGRALRVGPQRRIGRLSDHSEAVMPAAEAAPRESRGAA